jgi:hypothetical protein
MALPRESKPKIVEQGYLKEKRVVVFLWLFLLGFKHEEKFMVITSWISYVSS